MTSNMGMDHLKKWDSDWPESWIDSKADTPQKIIYF